MWLFLEEKKWPYVDLSQIHTNVGMVYLRPVTISLISHLKYYINSVLISYQVEATETSAKLYKTR